MSLDGPLEGAGAIYRVKSRICKEFQGPVRQFQADLGLCETLS